MVEQHELIGKSGEDERVAELLVDANDKLKSIRRWVRAIFAMLVVIWLTIVTALILTRCFSRCCSRPRLCRQVY